MLLRQIWRRPQPDQWSAPATAGNAATAAPFLYAARAVFPSASIRRRRLRPPALN